MTGAQKMYRYSVKLEKAERLPDLGLRHGWFVVESLQ